MSGAAHTKSIKAQLAQLRNQEISSDTFSFEEPAGFEPRRKKKPKESDWSEIREDQEYISDIIDENVDVREAFYVDGIGEAKSEEIFPEELVNLALNNEIASMKQNPFEDSDTSEPSREAKEEVPLTPEELKHKRMNDRFGTGITITMLAGATLGIIGVAFGISRALLKRNHTRTMIL